MREPPPPPVDAPAVWQVRDAGDLPPEAITAWARLLLELANRTETEPTGREAMSYEGVEVTS